MIELKTKNESILLFIQISSKDSTVSSPLLIMRFWAKRGQKINATWVLLANTLSGLTVEPRQISQYL